MQTKRRYGQENNRSADVYLKNSCILRTNVPLIYVIPPVGARQRRFAVYMFENQKLMSQREKEKYLTFIVRRCFFLYNGMSES